MKDKRDAVSLLFHLKGRSQLANRIPINDGNKDLYTAGPLPFESEEFKVHFNQRLRSSTYKVTIEAALRLAQLDRVAEHLYRHVMEHHEVMGVNLQKNRAEHRRYYNYNLLMTKLVSKLKDEYFENIALKINLKVGGQNTAGQCKYQKYIQVVAAMDWPDVTKYRGSVSAQPRNQEIIMELFEAFKISNGCFLQKIIFYRDGTGEDQFNQVLRDEVGAIRELSSFNEMSKRSGGRGWNADVAKASSLPQASPPVHYTPPVASTTTAAPAGLPQSAPTPSTVSIYPKNQSMKANGDVVSQLFHLFGKSHLGNRIPAYDGRKSLYTAGPLPFNSETFNFELKQDQIRYSSFKVTIKVAPKPDMYALRQYLERRHLDPPQEVIKVLDIVLKATPFKNNFLDGRSFFTPDLVPMEEGVSGVEYRRGFHQSLRPTQMGLSLNINISARGFYESILVSDFVSKHINSDISVPLSDTDRKKMVLSNEEFGIHVGNELALVDARILPAPMLNYHDNTGRQVIKVDPSLGQWDMSNKKMINGGNVEFWTCVCFSTNDNIDLQQFCEKLLNKCKSKGMEFNLKPVIPIHSANPNKIERDLTYIHIHSTEEIAKCQHGKQLQLFIIILPDATGSYGKIKRVCETKLGVVSQCCRPKQASKLKDEYFDNIALKINLKVGGRNTVLDDAIRRSIPHVYNSPTIIMGAVVTRLGKNSSPSIASVVAAMDWPDVTKYRGSVSAQPHNQKIIEDLYTTKYMEGGMILELIKAFTKSTGSIPQKIIFYRDGVSEDQFNQVLRDEVGAIRKACSKFQPGFAPPIAVIVVQKRHNTRLFPADYQNPDMIDDNSGNILPGTVVDTVICHPKEFDFYLNSHAGRKGTNRPTHYHVLLDENNFTADELQIFTNNLCYTCTRSDSIVPPVYYAHQLAIRARYYIEGGDSPDGGSSSGKGGTSETNLEVKPLPSIKENVKEVMFFC
ncbi:hypothetical protein EZV62_002840 [Acer yangbiense]|uniref:Piwi domain-containing protein n=1 Tax=Acer yangbiense TaxID=1000413 RepID=A0A5C7IYA4_9ROSI|nr:hypothetical protein EZV62_002840 [Acer yangbiense]